MEDLIRHAEQINRQLARNGVKFGIYKKGVFQERLFPFDAIPRVISAAEWEVLSRGLVQRVRALNLFLKDVYGEKRILADGVVPEEFVYRSPGYLAPCEGILPPGGIYSHISGIDLVKGKDGTWYVLEDNLRIPSGASYPLIARQLCRRCSPDTFRHNAVMDNRNYGDLYVRDNVLYYKATHGDCRVGAIYRRVSDHYMDPLAFEPSSLIGIPNLMAAYRAGNVAVLNAFGNGAADDKGIYYFVPKMIQYYLGEEAILHNAPTYLPFYEEDRKYVMDHLDTLVIKDVAEAGGYGVVFGSKLSRAELEKMRDTILAQPRRFIAQEVIDFEDLPIMEGSEQVERKADLRAFVLSGAQDTVAWPSGLTRFSRNPDSFIVNSSQGGGFKDTWVLSH